MSMLRLSRFQDRTTIAGYDRALDTCLPSCRRAPNYSCEIYCNPQVSGIIRHAMLVRLKPERTLDDLYQLYDRIILG